MKQRARLLFWGVAPAVLLGVLPKLGVIEANWALALAMLWVGGVVVVVSMRFLSRVARVDTSIFDAWTNRSSPTSVRPQRLNELERLVEFSTLNAFDLNYRLRIVLRNVVTERLARRGLTIDSDASRQILGERAWSFLTPPKGAPKPAEGPGWHARDIRHIVEIVESL